VPLNYNSLLRILKFNCTTHFNQHFQVRTGRLAAWHLPGGLVGPPARWAATSNVKGGSGREERPLAMNGLLYTWTGAPELLVTPLLVGPVCLISQGRFKEPVRS